MHSVSEGAPVHSSFRGSIRMDRVPHETPCTTQICRDQGRRM